MKQAALVVLVIVAAFNFGWSCRGIEEATGPHQLPPLCDTCDCQPAVESATSASAITCAMAIGATVDAMQREEAIDDWAEDHARDEYPQLPIEKWKALR